MEIIQVQQQQNPSPENALVVVVVDETTPTEQQQQQRTASSKRARSSSTEKEEPRFRRVRIPVTLGPAIVHLKRELGFHSEGETIHWLLHQVRPELLPSDSTPPIPNSSRTRPSRNSAAITSTTPNNNNNNNNNSVPRPVCMAYPNDYKPKSTRISVAATSGAPAKSPVRATVVQASTVFFDTPATLDKAERLVAGAAAYGSQLVVFPEAFVGGYPWCVLSAATHSTKTNDDLQKYCASAIDVPGPEVDRLAKIAGKYKVQLVMGVVERAPFYLFSTVLFFDSLGRFLGQHRKLMLRAPENVVWYSAEKSSLPVYETSIGKIGGLICWDNKLPHLRTELYSKGVEIYCAPTSDAREVWKASMTHIALEGGCFVLSANQFCERRDTPLPPTDSNGGIPLDAITCAGGSIIVSPSGTILAGPNYRGECLVSADLDIDEIMQAKTEFGVRNNVGPDDVGWTGNESNLISFATDMKTEFSNKLSW